MLAGVSIPFRSGRSFSHRGSRGRAGGPPQFQSPLDRGVLFHATERHPAFSHLGKGVSIPFRSGRSFSHERIRINEELAREVSIPFRSGRSFSHGRRHGASARGNVSIPFRSGRSFSHVGVTDPGRGAGLVSIPFRSGRSFSQLACCMRFHDGGMIAVSIPFRSGRSFSLWSWR